MATTRIFSLSLLTTKQTLASLLSRSYASAAVPLSTRPSNSRSSSISLLRPLVAANFHRLSPVTTTVRGYSTQRTSTSLNDPKHNWSNRPPKETILHDGCDFRHWLVLMKKPEGDPTRDDLIDSYIKTLAQVVGSEDEARMKIYSVHTRPNFAFGALVSKELANKIKELPNVRCVLPNSYLDSKTKDYGGEPFINGQAVPYDPEYHQEWLRNNRKADYRNGDNARPHKCDTSTNVQNMPNPGNPPGSNPRGMPPYMTNPPNIVGTPPGNIAGQPQYNMGGGMPQNNSGGGDMPQNSSGGNPQHNEERRMPENRVGGLQNNSGGGDMTQNSSGGNPQHNEERRMPENRVGGLQNNSGGGDMPQNSSGGNPQHNEEGRMPENRVGGLQNNSGGGDMPQNSSGGNPQHNEEGRVSENHKGGQQNNSGGGDMPQNSTGGNQQHNEEGRMSKNHMGGPSKHTGEGECNNAPPNFQYWLNNGGMPCQNRDTSGPGQNREYEHNNFMIDFRFRFTPTMPLILLLVFLFVSWATIPLWSMWIM